jgi:hypothetical protein
VVILGRLGAVERRTDTMGRSLRVICLFAVVLTVVPLAATSPGQAASCLPVAPAGSICTAEPGDGRVGATVNRPNGARYGVIVRCDDDTHAPTLYTIQIWAGATPIQIGQTIPDFCRI